jgi:hypothetical protein
MLQLPLTPVRLPLTLTGVSPAGTLGVCEGVYDYDSPN